MDATCEYFSLLGAQNLCQTHSIESLLMIGCKKGRPMSVGGWREPHSDSDSSADWEDEEDSKLKELVSTRLGWAVCVIICFVVVVFRVVRQRW